MGCLNTLMRISRGSRGRGNYSYRGKNNSKKMMIKKNNNLKRRRRASRRRSRGRRIWSCWRRGRNMILGRLCSKRIIIRNKFRCMILMKSNVMYRMKGSRCIMYLCSSSKVLRRRKSRFRSKGAIGGWTSFRIFRRKNNNNKIRIIIMMIMMMGIIRRMLYSNKVIRRNSSRVISWRGRPKE